MDESQHEYTRDVDFAVFFREISKIEDEASKQGLNYEQLHIGGIGIREKGLNIDFIDRRLHGENHALISSPSFFAWSMRIQSQQCGQRF